MGTGGSFLPLSPLWLYIRLSPHTYKFLCVSFSFLPFPDSVRFGPPDFVSETLSSSFPKTYNYTAISLSKKLSFIFQLVKIIESSWKDFVKSSLLFRDQALDLLVSVSSIPYGTYTSDLSTLLSSRGLTIFRYGISYLEVSFTLRCFQRLSQPHSATLPCRWRDNRCTVGALIPVHLC